MNNKREWQISRNGEVWTDRFTTLESAITDLVEYKRNDPLATFVLSEMTEDEIANYTEQ